jgi:hypothetical protein
MLYLGVLWEILTLFLVLMSIGVEFFLLGCLWRISRFGLTLLTLSIFPPEGWSLLGLMVEEVLDILRNV